MTASPGAGTVRHPVVEEREWGVCKRDVERRHRARQVDLADVCRGFDWREVNTPSAGISAGSVSGEQMVGMKRRTLTRNCTRSPV